MIKMKMKKYRKQIVIGAIVLIMGILMLKPTYSINNNLLTSQIVDEIKIKDVSIDVEEEESTYTAKVEAIEETKINYIKITVSDEEKEYILIGYVGKTLNKEEETTITAKIDKDISEMKNINYEIK